ncbi:MAG TPA: VanW family protein [Gaiellaceae bacterium]|nr:VanW family protein [Gaiellaceae bacterium]
MTELATRLVPRARPRVSTVFVAVILVAAVTPYVRAVPFHGETLPGTSVAGVDLAGMGHAAAMASVQSAVLPALDREVQLSAGGKRLAVRPSELYALDAVATADAALAASRRVEPERIAALVGLRKVEVAPVLVERPEAIAAFLAQVRRAGGRSATAATVEMNGREPTVTPSSDGRRLDATGLLADVRRAAFDGGAVTARFVPSTARYSTADAERAAGLARDITGTPVYVFFEGRPLRTLASHELARLVEFEKRSGDFLVAFDQERVARVLGPAVGEHEVRAVDARFEVVGDRVRVVSDRPGVGLDEAGAVAGVTAAAYSPDRRIAEVRVAEVPAAVTADQLNALAITRKVSSFTTDMGVSSSNRIWNVQLMADYIDGTIIEPGKTFSFNSVVGERTAERGFREGQMIVGSLLLPSIGGGVCQTATTLFNNAFELGVPIVRRHNHSFYISHYPLGRDATVSWGGPDLVFKNDLGHALLIKSSYTSSTLTFTFYGTPTGRRVASTTSAQTNWRPPATSYAYDPYAPRGSIRTSTGSNQSGFDVTVNRTVFQGDKVLRKDSFPSRYIPVGPTVVYGPGTNPPRIDFTLPPPE